MKICPFRALRYNPEKIPDLASVVAPPYDVISPEMQEALYRRSPHNIVRLILNRDGDPYRSAALHLSQWVSNGTLVRDPRPAIYLTEEVFRHPLGGRVSRKGFVALAELEDFQAGSILPHEKTLVAPKADRLNLIPRMR